MRTMTKSLSPDETLRQIRARIEHLLENGSSKDDEVELFFFLLHALNHHRRYISLKPKTIERYSETAFSLLNLNHVSETSVNKNLLLDLLTIIANLTSKGHLYKTSVIYRGLCLKFKVDSEMGNMQTMLLGLDCLQLGLPLQAKSHLEAALDKKLTSKNRALCGLAILKTMRYLEQKGEFNTFFEKISKESQNQPGIIELMEWEKCLFNTTIHGEPYLKELKRVTSKGKALYKDHFVLTTYGLNLCGAGKANIENSPSPLTLSYRKTLNVKNHVYYKPMNIAAEVYDETVHINMRRNSLVRLSEFIDDPFLLPIKEILILMVARWLDRQGLEPAASIYTNMYRNLSRSLSDGRNEDITGLGSDLIKNTRRDLLKIYMIPVVKVIGFFIARARGRCR